MPKKQSHQKEESKSTIERLDLDQLWNRVDTRVQKHRQSKGKKLSLTRLNITLGIIVSVILLLVSFFLVYYMMVK